MADATVASALRAESAAEEAMSPVHAFFSFAAADFLAPRTHP